MALLSTLVFGIAFLSVPGFSARVIVKNNCDKPLYMWAIGVSNVADDQHATVEPFTHQLVPLESFYDVGTSLKINDEPFYQDGLEPIVQVEWHVEADGRYYYDLSNVDCKWDEGVCPFMDGGFSLHSGPGCREVYCDNQYCPDAYQWWEPAPLRNAPAWACNAYEDLTVETCVGNGYASQKKRPYGGNPDNGKEGTWKQKDTNSCDTLAEAWNSPACSQTKGLDSRDEAENVPATDYDNHASPNFDTGSGDIGTPRSGFLNSFALSHSNTVSRRMKRRERMLQRLDP